MNCPKCGEVLDKGEVQVRGTIPGFLLIGFSYQHLWWHPEDGRREMLLKSGAKYEAFRCPSCGTAVIPA